MAAPFGYKADTECTLATVRIADLGLICVLFIMTFSKQLISMMLSPNSKGHIPCNRFYSFHLCFCISCFGTLLGKGVLNVHWIGLFNPIPLRPCINNLFQNIHRSTSQGSSQVYYGGFHFPGLLHSKQDPLSLKLISC
jgi:hypothetical protein